ncbi:ABC transporter gloK [Metarhizium anisopliae]|nr:ABC transporter gloK [Metarhizium anisopliae]
MLYDECDIVILDNPFSSLGGRTEDQVINNLFGPEGIFRTRRSTVFWITNATHHFKLADSVVILENSRIKEHGHWSVLDSLPDASGKVMSDDFHESGQVDAEASQLDAQKKKAKELDTRLDLNRKTGNLSLYAYYFKSAGLFNAIFMIGCTATYSFFITFPHYWLKRWTEADQNVEWLYMMVYGLLALFAWVATNGTMCFSQDIQLVDRDLPAAFQSLSNQIFKLLVQVALLLAVQKLLLLTIPLCFVVICLVARVYFRTSRQVRIEELVSRSAVFSQIVETVEGLITIRAFRWQSRCQSHFDRALDGSQGPLYLLSSLQRWLNLVLDLMIATISVTIIVLALFLRSTTTGAAVGIALNIILVTNTTIVRLVESWADFEVSLGAIERLKTLDEEIQKEDRPGEDNIPETSWPQRGEIVIDHVTAAYNGRSASLRNISLTIKASQKVVVGNSTLLLSLLRLVEITGDISVDGVDLSRISRAAIREQCFITVPQDPMLLPDTPLHFSLDPSGKAETSQIVVALQKTGVWSLLCESNAANVAEVLDRKMSELPALSVGQLQLLGIARALVKKAVLGTKLKPVLLLDEATSSLDTATESLIHNLIDEEFFGQGYTVVAVAHRLGVVTGRIRPMDMVVMMADGAMRKVGGAEEVLGSDFVSPWTS